MYVLLVRCFDSSKLLLLLGMTFGEESLVLGLLCLLGVQSSVFERSKVTAALKANWGNQALDLGTTRQVSLQNHTSKYKVADINGEGRDSRFRVWFSTVFLLASYLSTDDKLPDIVFLLEIEESSDLRSPLRSKTFGEDTIAKAGNFLFTLFDNNKGKDSNIGSDDASTHGLAFPLSSTACSIARVTIGK